MRARSRHRVLLLGWDAADWRFIEPLIERGLMPTLAALRSRGTWGNLATLQPALSPMLWTSIATGLRPTKHRIASFVEPLADGSGIRPVASTSRRGKALWNIASQSGLRSLVTGWYATRPAERIAGVVVADGFERAVAPLDEPWPIPADSVHPRELADTLAELRVHPGELDASALLPFVPRAAEIDQQSDPRLRQLAGLLAQTVSLHAISTHLLATEDWDLAAFYYEGIDRFGHDFMQCHPPAQPDVPARDVELYGEVMTGCYRFHDMLLDRLLQLAGPETTVVLLSDHGYHHDARRPSADADPLAWHRPMGMICLAGPGVRRGERVFGAHLLDVAPTVLALLGLPASREMPGRILQEALAEPAPPRIASWEEVSGADGREDLPRPELDPHEAAGAIRQLVELGYLAAQPDDARQQVEEAQRLIRHNLALAHLDAGEPAEAATQLRQLHTEAPARSGLTLQLALAEFGAGRFDEARALLQPLAEGDAPLPRAWLMLGRLELAAERPREALIWLRRAAVAAPEHPAIGLRLGQALLAAGQPAEALAILTPVVAAETENAVAWEALAHAQLELGAADRAVESALRAIEIAYFFPRAHLRLGLALRELGQEKRAAEALAISLAQAPNLAPARRALDALRR
ncbi:MAG: alkaline phosphatase family protein [Verrucomicrobia bacterium]|nr:alkaline phosphatase family protein [Verrucomicrobiota bacterium]